MDIDIAISEKISYRKKRYGMGVSSQPYKKLNKLNNFEIKIPCLSPF